MVVDSFRQNKPREPDRFRNCEAVGVPDQRGVFAHGSAICAQAVDVDNQRTKRTGRRLAARLGWRGWTCLVALLLATMALGLWLFYKVAPESTNPDLLWQQAEQDLMAGRIDSALEQGSNDSSGRARQRRSTGFSALRSRWHGSKTIRRSNL